jgi:hypothetical protein
MWRKPGELTHFKATGYEIAASGTPTSQSALEAWKSSPRHHEVILNEEIWRSDPPRQRPPWCARSDAP